MLVHHATIRGGATFANREPVRYLARQEVVNGRIKQYEVSVSPDGKQWSRVSEGHFRNSPERQSQRFQAPQKARYLKLTALSEQAGNHYTTVAELDIMAIR